MVTDARVEDIVDGDKVPEGNGGLPGPGGRGPSYGERVRARWKYGALMGWGGPSCCGASALGGSSELTALPSYGGLGT